MTPASNWRPGWRRSSCAMRGTAADHSRSSPTRCTRPGVSATATRLTLEAYHACGGARGAIARSADDVIDGLSSEDADLAREIFLRLTVLGEGRRTPVDARRELEIEGLGAAAPAVLERLVTARLVTADDTTVELAHDALIREWPQLRRWIDSDRERRRTLTRLTRAGVRMGGATRGPLPTYGAAHGSRPRRRPQPRRDADHERAWIPRRQRGGPTRRGTSGTTSRPSAARVLAGVGVALVLALIAGLVATRQRDASRHRSGSSSRRRRDGHGRAARRRVEGSAGRRPLPWCPSRGGGERPTGRPRHRGRTDVGVAGGAPACRDPADRTIHASSPTSPTPRGWR